MTKRPGLPLLTGCFAILLVMITSAAALAAPYASMVVDARTGQVLHAENADTRLHPASLTKMMTLYIAFQAIERGEISVDSVVTISRNSASEPPSKLGLRAGQKIALRYLIRAAAVKSANDAATAIGEAISGSEAAFARRMTATAQALGMTRTTFRNAHGLTEEGHLSTARDMTLLGRHLFFDYPQYYNLFSRRSTDAGVTQVANTNRKFLAAYKGADGIKTGYTRAAGFNLVASAERGSERIIATVFGGTSTANRNQRVAQLLDLGFDRAPSRVAVVAPRKPGYAQIAALAPTLGSAMPLAGTPASSVSAMTVSLRPQRRPVRAPSEEVVVALAEGVDAALAEAQVPDATEAVVEDITTAVAIAANTPPADAADETSAVLDAVASALEAADVPILAEAGDRDPGLALAAPGGTTLASLIPRPRPEDSPAVVGAGAASGASTAGLASLAVPAPEAPRVVTRISTAGGRHWGINVGEFPSRDRAERVLLQTALAELGTLDEALRRVVPSSGGFEANFVGLTEESAALACRRLAARAVECRTFGPAG